MRRLLLGVMMAALFVAPIRDPAHTLVEPAPPASFPLTFDRASAPAPRRTLLLLPLDGDATRFALTSPEAGVRFDLDGDGVKEQVAWPQAGANVAFLAIDWNDDGRITSGKELFGSATLAEAAPGVGAVHRGHALYDRLLLWVDRNHDGRSDPSELTNARHRFTAIGMGYQRVSWADMNGNRIRSQGWMHARTAGPDQGDAVGAADERARRRQSFDVELSEAVRK